jgi:hypothetical protein
MFGRKRDEVTGDWKKLHKEELHSLYSSPNVIKGKNKVNISLLQAMEAHRVVRG